MSEKLSIEPRVRSLVSYLDEIEKGIVQIPSFQRDYVWTRDKIKDLFDSIKNSYPIGSILFWKPEFEIGKNQPKIGSYYVLESKTKSPIYILDGFQRLSTLFGCLISPNRTKLKRDDKEWKEYFSLYYDLLDEYFTYLRPNSLPLPYQVPVYILMNSSEFRQYTRKEFEKLNDEEAIDLFLDRADRLSRTFLDYQIASIDINNAVIDEAVEIFSRVNSKGQEISYDWMASALSSKSDFRLGDELDNLLDELRQFNFQDIKRDVIFRCIQSSFGKIYFDNTKIEDLAKRADFPIVTKKTLIKVKSAVQFLFEELMVIDSSLIPYNIQLIFIMDFFKAFESPSEKQKEQLKEWFWITTYSNYFTIYSLANQRKAYDHFQEYLKGTQENPVYNDKQDLKFVTEAFPEKINFKSVRAKALTLFMLNYSNSFNKIEANDVDGLTLNKLFSHFIKAENTVVLTNEIKYHKSIKVGNLNLQMPLKKQKDLSFWLKSNNIESFKPFFINDKIQELYKEDIFNMSEILLERKSLIIESEKKFVENLGLIYS